MAQREVVLGERLLIRLDKDGTIDEVVGRDENGEVEFHVERTDDGAFWMHWYSTRRRVLKSELTIHLIGMGPIRAAWELEGETT